MGIPRLLLRVTVGGYFFGHGMQKLAGWFGGSGPEGTGQFLESVGLRPGRQKALAAGTAEVGGGTLLALGLATPAAVSALTGVMVSAIRHVHWSKGPWNTAGGYELHAIVIASLAALAEVGPGPVSLDALLGSEVRGTRVALTALAAGAAGSIAISRLGQGRQSPPARRVEEPTRAEEPAAASSLGNRGAGI